MISVLCLRRFNPCFLKLILFLSISLFSSFTCTISGEATQNDTSNKFTVLETINSFYGHWGCANENFLYGINPSNPRGVLRKRESGQEFEIRGNITQVDPGFTNIERIYSTSVPGVIFTLVQDKNQNFSFLKSSDGGLTFKKVFVFGEGNSTGGLNTPNVRVLRGILELTRDVPGGGGKGTLFIGEYNVSHQRIPGGINDRIRIMKSVDGGETWSKVTEWNTNGTNQVGHIHAMKQDPYTGEIYVCMGDGDNKAGIIKWDGLSAWKDNSRLSDIALMTGFKVLTGTQRYRICDVLFGENYFYAFTDTQTPNNPDGSESGIWKGTRDFTSYTRVNNQIFEYDPMHIGWFGEKIGNTYIFTTAREVDGLEFHWKQINTRVYTSNDGDNWNASGIIGWRDFGGDSISKYISQVFTLNNRIYIDCVGGAGHNSTIQCTLSKKWNKDEDPVILHPVYFLGKWNAQGSDSNSGINPDAPRRTLKNILENNKISAGARIRLAAGNWNETTITPQWSGTFIQGRGSVIIEGKGPDSTRFFITPATTDTSGIIVESRRTLSGKTSPLTFKDMELSNRGTGSNKGNSFIFLNRDSYVKTTGCRLGGKDNDESPLIRLGRQGAGYISEKTYYISPPSVENSNQLVDIGSVKQVVDLRNCLILNFYDALNCKNAGLNLSIENCTFYGITRYGIVFNSQLTVQPVILNNIFFCGKAPVADFTGLSENSIDYNFYNIPNQDVNGGVHSIVGGDPLFVNTAQNNFDLQNNSPCGMKGLFLSDVLTDIKGRKRSNPPSMGAYESPVLKTLNQQIQLDSLAGASALLVVYSNIQWRIDCNCNWIKFSQLSGTGSDTVTISALSSNNSVDSRMINFNLIGSGSSNEAVSVVQNGWRVTSLPDLRKKQMNVFPNPVSGILTIDYSGESFKYFVLIDNAGRILSKKASSAPLENIDFSGFSNGIYYLRFENPGFRIIKVEVIH